MEDPDIVFLGYGSSNSLDSSSTSTEENRRHYSIDLTTFLNRRGVSPASDFGNYPGTSGNQDNVSLYDNLLPSDDFLQTPPTTGFLAQYNDVFGRVGEEATPPNVAGVGPNETLASHPGAKNPRSSPQVERMRKILKVNEAAVEPKEKGESNYQRLLDLQDCDLVRNTEVATCPGCIAEVPLGAGVVLKNCLHIFCGQCLEEAVLISESVQVKCPFRNEEYSCQSYLQDREVKSLVSPLRYELLLARCGFQSQSQLTNTFHCAKPGCFGVCLIENGTDGACSVCLSRNCVSCRTIHDAMGCPREKDIVFVREVNDKIEKEVQKPQENQRSENYGSVEEPTSTKDLPAGYLDLLEVTDKGLVSNMEKFNCPICFSEIEIGEGVTLKDCLHNYCRECLRGTILHSETVVVKCPFITDEYACESFIQEREVKWLLTSDEHERHLARGLAQAERQSDNSFHCKTPDCAGWCLVENDATQFVCQVCQRSNCLSCAAIHEGKNCKQYQDLAILESDTSEEAKKTKQYLERQLKNNTAVPCPKCKVIIVKRGGCDHMTCAMCGTHFSWATKRPYTEDPYFSRYRLPPVGNFPPAPPTNLGRHRFAPWDNFPLAPPTNLGRYRSASRNLERLRSELMDNLDLAPPTNLDGFLENLPLAPDSNLGRHRSELTDNLDLASPSYRGRYFRGLGNPIEDPHMTSEHFEEDLSSYMSW